MNVPKIIQEFEDLLFKKYMSVQDRLAQKNSHKQRQ